MIKTIRSVFCDVCDGAFTQFYTLSGMVYCSTYVNHEVRHEYQTQMTEMHVCDNCFKNMKIKFNRDLKRYVEPIIEEEEEEEIYGDEHEYE